MKSFIKYKMEKLAFAATFIFNPEIFHDFQEVTTVIQSVTLIPGHSGNTRLNSGAYAAYILKQT